MKESAPRAWQNEKDDILILMFQRGNKNVFGILIERYQQKVRNLIYSIFNDPIIVDDLAQEIFIKAYQALPSFRFESSFYTWLYRITVNKCRDEMRRRKLRKFLSLQTLLENPGEEVNLHLTSEMNSSEEHELVSSALAKLPERFRVPVVLKDIEGFSYEEIAEMTKARIGTVKSRIARGRLLLRTMLSPLLKEGG